MTHFIRWRHDSDENGNLATRVLSGYELARKEIILHVHHALLFISLPSLPDYYVKLPIFTCSGAVLEDVYGTKKILFFFFWSRLECNSRKRSKSSPLEHFMTNIERDGTRAKTFSGPRSHFWSPYWERLKWGNQADKFGCLKVSLWFNRFVFATNNQIYHARLTRLT